ncbi:hypothetical protein AK812_SmicGene9691 [Symbiodinium microadriaticum]|uniref:Uncharacterized protein n=1 Tax=Symbiodinium microadriaticum TaxID=2951 RepID=A0A1Q9EHN8_SYMMI|nr:hypothetical protein AK812_SmicGene9691 [Symbiodinium microadriaticum]
MRRAPTHSGFTKFEATALSSGITLLCHRLLMKVFVFRVTSSRPFPLHIEGPSALPEAPGPPSQGEYGHQHQFKSSMPMFLYQVLDSASVAGNLSIADCVVLLIAFCCGMQFAYSLATRRQVLAISVAHCDPEVDPRPGCLRLVQDVATDKASFSPLHRTASSKEKNNRLPGHHETFVAILDSIDPVPRLPESSVMNPEDAEVAAQAIVAAGPRHSDAVKHLQEYLKKEWEDCRFARRMLEDPNILDFIVEYKASPPQLSAPTSGQLRSKWRRVGDTRLRRSDNFNFCDGLRF